MDPTLERLEDQIGWYDRKSLRNQRSFKSLKGTSITLAVFIPLCAGLSASPWITGGLGGLIAVLEGLQQLNQYQQNWIAYRSTCEALKHEKYLYLGKAGPYTGSDAHALLAERIESLISQEHAKWIAGADKLSKSLPSGPSAKS